MTTKMDSKLKVPRKVNVKRAEDVEAPFLKLPDALSQVRDGPNKDDFDSVDLYIRTGPALG